MEKRSFMALNLLLVAVAFFQSSPARALSEVPYFMNSGRGKIVSEILPSKYFNFNKETVQTISFPQYLSAFQANLTNSMGDKLGDICRLLNMYHYLDAFSTEVLFDKTLEVEDMVFYNRFIYVVTKDLEIYQFDMNFDSKVLAFVHKLSDFVTVKTHLNPRFVVSPENKRVLVMHEDAAFGFDLERSLYYSDVKKYNVTGYQPRAQIYAAVKVKGYIFVACGDDGIDIYRELATEVRLVKNLNSEYFNMIGINITDIKKDNSVLSFLEDKTGQILIYNLKTDDIESLTRSPMNVPALFPTSYDFAGNIFIVAERAGSGSLIKEYVLNWTNNSRVLNRDFPHGESVQQMIVVGSVAFAAGNNTHFMMTPGVSGEFVPDDRAVLDPFLEMGLKKMLFIPYLNYGNFLIQLTSNGLSIQEVHYPTPAVKCGGYPNVREGKFAYQLDFFATQCDSMTEDEKMNLLDICRVSVNLDIEIGRPRENDSNKSMAIGLGVGLSLFFILVIIVLVFAYQKKSQARFQRLEEALGPNRNFGRGSEVMQSIDREMQPKQV